jgi:DNA-directed RNA polymerase specialized sigma24 family protein
VTGGRTRADESGDVAVFTEHRGLLLGVAYWMLGSMADPEDVVQDAWLHWSTVDASTVRDSENASRCN